MTLIETKKSTINTCGYCGHTGTDVNYVGYEHVGGIGDREFPICDDPQACIARVEDKGGKK